MTAAEIAALEALGNSAEAWEQLSVSEDFQPCQLLQSRFEGRVEIASGVRVIRSRVANYRLGEGVLVECVTSLECRRPSAFGNGVGVVLLRRLRRLRSTTRRANGADSVPAAKRAAYVSCRAWVWSCSTVCV